MGSRRPVAAEAKPLLQLVRATWVCVSVAVLPLPSPILRFILLWWIVALFLTHTVQLPAWEVGRNLTLLWLVPYKGKWQAYLQNMAHVDDVSVAKLCPLPSHPCCITEREERSQSKLCNCYSLKYQEGRLFFFKGDMLDMLHMWIYKATWTCSLIMVCHVIGNSVGVLHDVLVGSGWRGQIFVV